MPGDSITSMGRAFVLILLWFSCVAPAPALDLVVPFDENGHDQAEPTGIIPGREAPVTQSEPMAVTFSWDDYITRVVIEAATSNKSLRAPAWVVTYDLENHVQVAYRGTAFRDKDGRLHIDARKAIITGPRVDGWSPDSFVFSPDGTVQTIDDRNSANGGTVTETVLGKDSSYKRLLLIAMAIVREAL